MCEKSVINALCSTIKLKPNNYPWIVSDLFEWDVCEFVINSSGRANFGGTPSYSASTPSSRFTFTDSRVRIYPEKQAIWKAQFVSADHAPWSMFFEVPRLSNTQSNRQFVTPVDQRNQTPLAQEAAMFLCKWGAPAGGSQHLVRSNHRNHERTNIL